LSNHTEKGKTMLNYTKYLIREEVSFLKLLDRFNIFDPESNKQIGYSFEDISMVIKLLRLSRAD
jgi:hypothetical protein